MPLPQSCDAIRVRRPAWSAPSFALRIEHVGYPDAQRPCSAKADQLAVLLAFGREQPQDQRRDRFGRAQRLGIFAGKSPSPACACASGPGSANSPAHSSFRIRRHRSAPAIPEPPCSWHSRPRTACACAPRPTTRTAARPASEARSSGSSERISRQLAVTLMSSSSWKCFGLEMRERRQRAEHAGIAEKGVEPAPAFEDREAEPIERGEILEVERHERCGAAGLLDFVVDFFQRADRARHEDHMRAGRRQRQSRRASNAARSAGDERNAVWRMIGKPCSCQH